MLWVPSIPGRALSPACLPVWHLSGWHFRSSFNPRNSIKSYPIRTAMEPSLNKSKTKIQILLADDHNMVRAGIRQLIESAGDMIVIAEASDGEEAQALIQQHRPDVAVLDIQMPKATGIAVTRWVRANLPEV